MTFVLGNTSLKNLEGVDRCLVAVVKQAIVLSPVDFGVHEGVRTIEKQREYVRTGVSKTMNSKHLHGKAVDLVPYIGGVLRWEWEPIYSIALAMAQAASGMGVCLRWGGVWDKSLTDFGGSIEQIKRAVADYCVRHPGPDFLDGPHFETLLT
jgi:peptidoglycan L-alanyl-D-glutamate endopeptidase CwlK